MPSRHSDFELTSSRGRKVVCPGAPASVALDLVASPPKIDGHQYRNDKERSPELSGNVAGLAPIHRQWIKELLDK
jgi:hypothetical protein